MLRSRSDRLRTPRGEGKQLVPSDPIMLLCDDGDEERLECSRSARHDRSRSTARLVQKVADDGKM